MIQGGACCFLMAFIQWPLHERPSHQTRPLVPVNNHSLWDFFP